MNRLVLVAGILALLLTPVFSSPAFAKAPPSTSLERVRAVVQPSIVYLDITWRALVVDTFQNPDLTLNKGKPFSLSFQCTGFFVDPRGHIVTAAHCVQYTDDIKSAFLDQAARWAYSNHWYRGSFTPQKIRQFAESDYRVRNQKVNVNVAYGVSSSGLPSGRALPADIQGLRDAEKQDVALLKIEGQDLPALQLAPDAEISVGTRVVSIGYPASVDYVTDPTFDPSFKDGSISSKKTVGGGLLQVYEISAAVSGGMSGGPTVDTEGRVIGVNSFGIRGETQPFNFIRPASNVSDLLVDKGVKNQLGTIGTTYRLGLAAYFAGHREKALDAFNQVLAAVPSHALAQEFKAKALRLPKESKGLALWVIALIIIGALAALGALTAAFLATRRGGPAAPAAPAQAPGVPPPAPAPPAAVAPPPPAPAAAVPAPPPPPPAAAPPVPAPPPVAATPTPQPPAAAPPPPPPVPAPPAATPMPAPPEPTAPREPAPMSPGPIPGLAPAILIKDGPLTGQRFDVESELMIGRENADITIDDPEISRRHAILRPVDGSVEISDAGSSNGTFVNGTRIDDGNTRLTNGDVITIGQTTIEVEVHTPRSAATVVRPSPSATVVSSVQETDDEGWIER